MPTDYTPATPMDVKSFIRSKIYLVRPEGYMTVLLVNEGLNVDNPREAYTEVRERNQHLSVPILVKTGDSIMTGSCTAKVSEYYSTSGGYSLYEFLTKTGRASGLTGVLTSEKDTITIKQVTWTADKTETQVLSPCVVTNVNFNPNGDNGVATLSFQYECFANEPTIVAGDVP